MAAPDVTQAVASPDIAQPPGLSVPGASWLDTTGGGGQPPIEAGDVPTPDNEQFRRVLVQKLGDDPPRRWLDLDDVDHFVEIANRIYTELSARLRFDLIVERERSGSLMDRN